MLYTILLFILIVLAGIYIKINKLSKIYIKNEEKNYNEYYYLAFSKKELDKGLEKLNEAIINFEKCDDEYLDNKEKYENSKNNKNINKLEKYIKNMWKSQYELNYRSSLYRAMFEANIAVHSGVKNIEEVKLEFEKKFNDIEFMFNTDKKVQKRWEDLKKEI